MILGQAKLARHAGGQDAGRRVHGFLRRLTPDQREIARAAIQEFHERRASHNRMAKQVYKSRRRQAQARVSGKPQALSSRVSFWDGDDYHLLQLVLVRKDHPCLFYAQRDIPKILRFLSPGRPLLLEEKLDHYEVRTGYATHAKSVVHVGRAPFVRYVYGVFPRKPPAPATREPRQGSTRPYPRRTFDLGTTPATSPQHKPKI